MSPQVAIRTPSALVFPRSPVQKLLVGQDLLQPADVLQLEGEHSRGGVVGEHLDDARGERQGHLACDLHNAPVDCGHISI